MDTNQKFLGHGLRQLAFQAIVAIAFLLAAVSLLAAPPGSESKHGAERARPERPLFLDVFLAQEQPVVTKSVEWESAVGKQRGRLVRPDGAERLPALLVIASGEADPFLLQSARELAGIGYAVLVVPLERNEISKPPRAVAAGRNDAARREQSLAQLSSAARWMRGREDVLADKVGVLGWGQSARWALEVAAAQALPGAVLVDVELPVAIDAPLSIGLARTAVLVVRGGADETMRDRERLATFQRALADAHVEHRVLDFKSAKTGFLDPQSRDAFDRKSADRAWFEIYEFFGKHVEDAELKPPPPDAARFKAAPSARPLASIADVMRAINGPAGLRGGVARSLNEGPTDEKQWKLLRARGAVMADSGEWLAGLKPPRGTQPSWRRHAASYRDAAAELAIAADNHDTSAARRAFNRLNQNCTRCHAEHR